MVKKPFKIICSGFLNSTYFKYYFPEQYMSTEVDAYETLSNGLQNGFNSLYKYDKLFNNRSMGKFDPNDTIVDSDPYFINIQDNSNKNEEMELVKAEMAPHEQIINIVVTTTLRKQLGVNAGDEYKLLVFNKKNLKKFYLRSKITHSLKAGPGLDILRPEAYVSYEQAQYIYEIL